MDPDDVAYRKSVRNMAAVLAVISIVIFGALFIPPYLNPSHDEFQSSVSFGSAFGFTMYLTLNSTTISPLGQILLTGWLNSTSQSIQNVTSSDSWAYPLGSLSAEPCIGGWPMGFGVIQGHYTEDNYTLGTPIPLNQTLMGCLSSLPQYLLLYPQSSQAQASINGSLTPWLLRMELTLGQGSLRPNAIPGVPGPSGLPPGVYTAVLADEWGDVLTTNFVVR